ncbi:MAG: ketoacyl-ACP synthase III [Bdellovibrionales bacterium]|nr:ketoacyl-ACP synthase III [Bdellovibrionales bacterium]
MVETRLPYGSQVLATGAHFPRKVMKNVEFESFVETSDEWIKSRTGIESRRIADPALGETTLTLSLEAARVALDRAGVRPDQLEFIVVGTVTPDTIMPSTATQLQALLGAPKAFAFDLSAACSGFLYGMSIADQYISAGRIGHALVIGAETLSTVINWRDRTTCVLFGDGAGAAVLGRTEGERRILSTRLYSDGQYGDLLSIPHGCSKVPVYSPEYRLDLAKIQMKGREIFKLAIRNMLDASASVLSDAGMTTADVDFFIFHQANIRIIDMCAKSLNVPPEKTWVNVDKYGNTSAATLPACLYEAQMAGKVKEGDTVLMATFGGGLTWGASLIRI